MELELTPLSQTSRCMTLTHRPSGTTMQFHKKTWKYFQQNQITGRLFAWQQIADGTFFRKPISWETDGDELFVHLPALPEGYISLSRINSLKLNDTSKTKLMIALTEALAKLHRNQFYMGFLVPEMIYFHPKRLTVLLDVQPFSSAYPFVNHLLEDFPYILLSNFARKYDLSRVSDFYSIGLMMQWMYLGRLPKEPQTIAQAMPRSVHLLCHRLMIMPQSYLFAEEIANEFRRIIAEDPQPIAEPAENLADWLHPMVPPIESKSQSILRSFLRAEGMKTIGIICEDEVTRLNVLRQHIVEVLERHFFFNIRCKNLPFAALRESIQRTLYMAYEYMPEASSRLRALSRKFERLLSRYFQGDDLIHTLADWIYAFYTEIMPMFQLQSFYYIYEDCQLIDEDSQRVFLNFWQKYSDKISGLHAIFSGSNRPSLFPRKTFYYIHLGHKDADLYRSLLISRLGRAEPALLIMLVDWMQKNEIEYHHCSIILEELIELGCIKLTKDGWHATADCCTELIRLNPDLLIDRRIARLQASDLEFLRLIACQSHPIRPRTMFTDSGSIGEGLPFILNRLARMGLLLVFSDDSVFIPFDVATRVLHDLPSSKQTAYYQKSMPLLQKNRYVSYPALIETARLAEDARTEYYYLIKYYRQIRNLLTVERRKMLIDNIRQLQHKLQRTKVLCWDRLLCQLCLQLNLYAQAEVLAASLYQRTNAAYDRFILMRIKLFTNQLDVAASKKELLAYLSDNTQKIADRVHAAGLLIFFDFFMPLHRESAEVIHHIYLTEFHPNRHLLSTRLFAELSIMYTIMLFQYFPEQEEWTTALLDKIESALEGSPHQDLMIELSNSYIFHSNVRLSRRHIQRCLDISRRAGYKGKEQISHLNGMEISLFQGDVSSYRYHLQQVPRVDELKRKDISEQYLTHQLFYACEWEQWELFEEIYEHLSSQRLTSLSIFLTEIYKRYAAFRKGEKLPPPCQWEQTNEFTLFIDGLYYAQDGQVDKACEYFQKSIAQNNYRLQAGWSYREMIELMLANHSAETGYWLERFEDYLKKYGYDVFWPDLHRGFAFWTMQQGDLQRALLYLRRSVNGYQLIEKEKWHKQLSAKMSLLVQPSYVPLNSPLCEEPIVKKLMEERIQLLHQSLDLQIIIQLSEQVTESLDLDNTFHQLSNSLFRYFPVTHTSISCNLFYQKETFFYSASGLIDKNEQMLFQRSRQSKTKYEYMLYQQGDQFIKLHVYAKDLAETKRLHMEHFLSFIKPHIANALHYMEMMIDNLTGFYQRRYFLGQLQNELEISLRYGLDLSLIMIDIDNFRLVNEFGHQEGDRVLRELSDMVRSILRENDIPGRFGGEELLLILPKTDGKIAYRIAEDLRQQIEEEFANGRPYRVTISAGVASTELCQAKTIDQLIRLADNAEIKAKTTGKNKVVAAWENLD